MKLAVAAQGQGLDSPVDMRFGRAPFFLVVDAETFDYEVITNPAVGAPGGAGIQTAQLLVRSGVQAVVTGNVGPNAMSALRAAGVEVYASRGGTVRENVRAFLRRELVPLGDATVASHFGVGAWSAPGGGAPGGPGMSQGRGGCGRGSGTGGGMGRGGGMGPGAAGAAPVEWG